MSLPHATHSYPFPRPLKASSHESISSKSRISPSKSSSSVMEALGCSSLSTGHRVLLLWISSSAKLDRQVLCPHTPDIQWWDRYRVMALDILTQKGGQCEAEKSPWSITILKSIQEYIGRFLISFKICKYLTPPSEFLVSPSESSFFFFVFMKGSACLKLTFLQPASC